MQAGAPGIDLSGASPLVPAIQHTQALIVPVVHRYSELAILTVLNVRYSEEVSEKKIPPSFLTRLAVQSRRASHI